MHRGKRENQAHNLPGMAPLFSLASYHISDYVCSVAGLHLRVGLGSIRCGLIGRLLLELGDLKISRLLESVIVKIVAYGVISLALFVRVRGRELA